MASVIDLGYRARPAFHPFHTRKERWSCIVAHRRAGKTVACIMDLIDAALRCVKPNGRYAYVAPFYAQAKDVAWSYVKQYTSPLPNITQNESELRVDLPNGARVRLYGADNYDRMRGIYLDGAVLDEYADMDPRAWAEVIRPALSDRKGWASFIGTPKGRNGFYEIMHGSDIWPGALESKDWFAMTLKASQSGLIEAEELADAQKTMTPDQYQQEYECSFDAAIVGSYYGADLAQAELEKRITVVPWERSVSVETSWDLGIDDATAIWFWQIVGRELRVIDYYEVNNRALTDIAKDLLAKPYTYGTHYLPHDVAIREMISGKDRKSSLEGVGIRPINVGVKADPIERVNATRMIMPRCVWDANKCKHGIEALKHYRRDWDEKRKTFRTTVHHDWSSHGADAFGEFAVNFRKRIERATEKRRRPNLGTST